MYSLRNMGETTGTPLTKNFEYALHFLDSAMNNPKMTTSALRFHIMNYHFYPQYQENAEANKHSEYTDTQIQKYAEIYKGFPATVDARLKALWAATKSGITNTNPEKMPATEISKLKQAAIAAGYVFAVPAPAAAPVAITVTAPAAAPVPITVKLDPMEWNREVAAQRARELVNKQPTSAVTVNQQPAGKPLTDYHFMIDGLHKFKFTIPKTTDGEYMLKNVYNQSYIYEVDVFTFNNYKNGEDFPKATTPAAAIWTGTAATGTAATGTAATGTAVTEKAAETVKTSIPENWKKYIPYIIAGGAALFLLAGKGGNE